MGELTTYLVENDDNFRKARLPALYSDFRPQQTLNPDGYSANINAWRTALARLARNNLLPTTTKSPSSPLILSIDPSLPRALSSRQFGQPLALGTALRAGISDRGLVPVQDFLKKETSVYYHGWGEVPWNVLGWVGRQVGLGGVSTTGEDKLPEGRFVIMQNVEKAGNTLNDLLQDEITRFERTFTKKQFISEYGTQVFDGQKLGEQDMDILLRYMSRDKKVIAYDGKVIKIKASGDNDTVSEEDATIAGLKELTATLTHQVSLLTARIDELTLAAKTALSKKNNVAAKAALKSKKLATSSLETRYATLAQLEETATKIEQAHDQIHIVAILESSTAVLGGLNKQVGGAERVEKVMEGVRDGIADVDEVAEIMAEGGRVVNEGEIDEELERLEREEREKEEMAEMEKMDALPEVPREVTPTTETGIRELSLGEKEKEKEEEKEEALLA